MEQIKRLKWSTNNSLDFSGIVITDDGEQNTQNIIDFFSNNNDSSPAAEYCYNFSSGGFDDWFLPSMKDFDINYKAIHKTLYEKYGGSFLNSFNYLWASNLDSVLSTRAISVGYNGCSGNRCRSPQNMESEIGTLPIRKF